MTGPEYTEKCVSVVAIMREAAAGDPALAQFLELFGLLQEPVLEDATNG
jgi:hypothetical protein